MASNTNNWKWWHFVVAGLLIAALGAWYISEGRISKGIGSELGAALCVAVGLFSRKSENQGNG